MREILKAVKGRYVSSIFIRVTVIISVFLALTIFLGGLLLVSLQKRSLLAEEENGADQMIEFVASISGESIRKMAYYRLYKSAALLQQGKDGAVLSLSVYDNKGKLLNPNGIHPDNISVSRKYWLIRQANCYYSSGKMREKVGKVIMIFNLKSVYETVADMTLLFSLIFVMIIIILDGILLMILRKLVVLPLRLLSSAADRISEGEFIKDAGIRSRDEMGFLAGRIVKMSSTLKKNFSKIKRQHAKIKDYSKNLEMKVEQRTEELHSANSQLKARNEQFVKELDMARRVQQSIIPSRDTFPDIPELDFGSSYLSMASVGGDLFDVIRVGRNGYGFLMADVSGHGVPSALITTMAKVSFTTHAGWEKTPAEICAMVNDDIHNVIKDLDYYLTAYFGVINLENGDFSFTNAGHHPAMVYRAEERSIEQLDTQGLFIGSFEDGRYEHRKTRLHPGDRMLLFTDGIVEARNPEGDFYDYKRLERFVVKYSNLKPGDFVQKLVDEIDVFCAGREADDDRAILFFEFIKRSAE